MKFKTLMIIKALVCLVLGVPIAIHPPLIYSLFGASLDAAGIFAAREYGASLLGNLMVTWFARNAGESDARRAIALGLCVYDAVGCVVTLIAIFNGTLNALAWGVAAIYLFFAIAFGYFLVRKPRL